MVACRLLVEGVKHLAFWDLEQVLRCFIEDMFSFL